MLEVVLTVLLAILAASLGAMVMGVWIGLEIATRCQQAAQPVHPKAHAGAVMRLPTRGPRRSAINTKALEALGRSQTPKPFSVRAFSEGRSA